MIRKVLFQVHLWTGIGFGLYVVAISLTGSLLVFRVEYYKYFRPGTTVAAQSTERLSDDAVKAAAERKYPAFKVTTVAQRRRQRTAPAEVYLEGNGTKLHRLFDPYTGEDLGNAEPRATQLFEEVAQLHDNLLGGRTGRTINGLGGLVLVVMSLTGMWIWWPSLKNWRRGMTVRWTSNWKRFNWDLHSAMGFWTVGFVLLFAITGAYLSDPNPFQTVLDYFEPPTDDNLGARVGDTLTYWLAYAHFGRFGGRLPGCGRGGMCESSLKAVWAVFGLVPAAMFVTGAVMWWNRVLCKFVRGAKRSKVLEPVGR